jgi:hypothetical protein
MPRRPRSPPVQARPGQVYTPGLGCWATGGVEKGVDEVAYELLLVCRDVRGLSLAVLRLSDVDNVVGMGIFSRCVGYGLRVVLVWWVWAIFRSLPFGICPWCPPSSLLLAVLDIKAVSSHHIAGSDAQKHISHNCYPGNEEQIRCIVYIGE